jgi:hypothetical protein
MKKIYINLWAAAIVAAIYITTTVASGGAPLYVHIINPILIGINIFWFFFINKGRK